MDVWHISGKRRVAEYRMFGSHILVFGSFGPGTPVGQFDRFEVIDGASGELYSEGLYLYEHPCEEDVRRLVMHFRMTRALA